MGNVYVVFELTIEVPGDTANSINGADDGESASAAADVARDIRHVVSDEYIATEAATAAVAAAAGTAVDTCIAAGGLTSLDLPQVGYYQLLCSFCSLKCF